MLVLTSSCGGLAVVFILCYGVQELAAAVALIMSEVDGVEESLHLESSKASQQLDEVLETLAGADWQIPVQARFVSDGVAAAEDAMVEQ